MKFINLLKNPIGFISIGILIGLTTILLYQNSHEDLRSFKQIQSIYLDSKPTTFFTSNSNTQKGSFKGYPSFADVAEKVIPAVVQIKISVHYNQRKNNRYYDNFFKFFDAPSPSSEHVKIGSGSGVIITEDGYIATNNHVVDGAEKIEVILNDNRIFQATVIGKDRSTDLALLKIDAKDLPLIKLGNSDKLRVGEWVLAIGNPFELYSTVTAGIVSAKSRNIGILNSNRMAIEAFIQTDAAINRGNSGGALVNAKGELIGIATAIASKGGSYEGYGFAIPINLAEKVMNDFKRYGRIKRGFLGVSVANISPSIKEEKNLSLNQGVYIADIMVGSPAEAAGLKVGDVITKIENEQVNTLAQLLEKIGEKSPDDKVSIEYFRGTKKNTVLIALMGDEQHEQSDLLSDVDSSNIFRSLGARFQPVGNKEKNKLGIKGGLKVSFIAEGKLFDKFSGIQVGDIIYKVNGHAINSVEQLDQALSKNNNGFVSFSGFSKTGGAFTSTFPLS